MLGWTLTDRARDREQTAPRFDHPVGLVAALDSAGAAKSTLFALLV